MKNLCFGGSFDPIHNGHLICATAVAERLGFDQVFLIPNHQSPHKPKHTSSAHRMVMCHLAAELNSQLFYVDGIEVANKTKLSYTIDTVRQLKALRNWDEVNWVIGADQLMSLPKWHNISALLCEVNFVIMQRPGTEIEWSKLIVFDKLPYDLVMKLKKGVVDSPMVDISSTQIRDRVAKGKSIEYLVPHSVADHIYEHELYRGT